MNGTPLGRLPSLSDPAHRLILIAFLGDAGVMCLLLAVQYRALELGASAFVSGLLGTAGFVLYVPVSLVAGRLSDRLGRRPVALISCAVCTLSWLAMWRAESAEQLLALSVVSGAGLGLLWPPVQAWLGDLSGDDGQRLNHNLGMFNIAWTTGLMVGSWAGGLACEHWGRGAFLIPVATGGLSLLVAILTPPGRHHEANAAPPPQVDPSVAKAFMMMAWCAAFAIMFSRAMIGAMFPRIGDSLGYLPGRVGLILFALPAAQLVAFAATRASSRWQYRAGPLMAMVVFTTAGLILGQVTSSAWLFVLSFAVIGGSTSLAFVSGITYALHLSAEGRGKRAGIHEAVIGAGLVAGPFVGGLTAQHLGLRAAFGAAAVVCGLALVGQLLLLRRCWHSRVTEVS